MTEAAGDVLMKKLWEDWKKSFFHVDPSLIAAGVISGAFFIHAVWIAKKGGEEDLAPVIALSLILFLLLTGILRALVRDIRHQITRDREGERDDEFRHEVIWFAVVKALVRCLLGVTLTLGWLAGVLVLLDLHFPGGFVSNILVAAVFSGAVFFLAFNLVHFLDRLRLPPSQ